MAGRSGSHWYSLHHDPLFDQFFTVFTLQFATMTTAVDTVVDDQVFLAPGDMCGQEGEKLRYRPVP